MTLSSLLPGHEDGSGLANQLKARRERMAQMSTLAENPAYKAYINGPVWAEKRKLKLQQVGYRCQGCSSDERLEVHHLTYERFGTERMEDLMVLCHICHAHEHGRAPNVGPVAGITLTERTEAIRLREALERRQAGVVEMLPVLKAWEDLKLELSMLDGALSWTLRKRIKCIDREMGKLLEEVGK